MKISSLEISNFRGIRDVKLTALGGMIIVAGQNGSGKSCIFDALRLLKSVYGGYQANEWQQWLGEFQIQLSNRSGDFAALLNDRSRELRITCEFKLAADERAYIQSHAEELLREKIWRTILPEAYEWGGFRMAAFASQFRDREPEVVARAIQEKPMLLTELAAPVIRGEFIVPLGGVPAIHNSFALAVIFSTFRPQDVGVIDYHGAQRHYGRELVQGVNLSLDVNEKQRSQSALYNHAAKYNNVKSEMAASFVKEVLAEQAGVARASKATLTDTLRDLFATFFPEKQFLGPTPTTDGGLSFPVKTLGGSLHDLDELSAGEKEILYGYLRIRNSAPRNSIILLDEPELHLNPRLIRGLPQFYQRHLGDALNNQIWLVTHSDALLREVVGKENYNVYHMLPCGNVDAGDNQLKPLSATADLELALVDLVGDLAAYKPGGKVVIFEGGGDSDFDQQVTASLFPELQQQANLISGSNKVRVKALHEILDKAYQRGKLPFKFFAITDRDADMENANSPVNTFEWDVYHIENYFLVPAYILQVLESLQETRFESEEAVLDELRNCAKETLPQLIRHRLSDYANEALISAISTKCEPNPADVVAVLHASIERSLVRIQTLGNGDLTKESLSKREAALLAEYRDSLTDGSWISKFPGRDVLRRFVGKHARSVSYEVFRNLITSKMKETSYRPAGMERVVNQILES